MSDLVIARNCCVATMLPGEAELVSESTGLPGRAKSVQRFEPSNGPDTALYKNYLYLLPLPLQNPNRHSISHVRQKLLMLLTSSFIQWHKYKWWCHLATTCMIVNLFAPVIYLLRYSSLANK